MRNNIQRRNIRFKKINESAPSYYINIITDEDFYNITLIALYYLFNTVDFNYKGNSESGYDLLKKGLSVSDILNLEPYRDVDVDDEDYDEDEDEYAGYEDAWSILFDQEKDYVLEAGAEYFGEHEDEFETRLIQQGEKVYDAFEDFSWELLDRLEEIDPVIGDNEKQLAKDLLNY